MDLEKLAQGNLPLNPKKFEQCVQQLGRMRSFYKEKAEVAPERQAQLFKGFVNALTYAIDNLQMHNKLTKQLAELTEGGTNVTETTEAN